MAVAAPPAEETFDQILQRLLTDFEFFCGACLRVEDKETLELIPFQWKPVQRRLAATLLEKWMRGAPVRLIILKARREGVSTLVQAFMFWVASTRPSKKGVTIANDEETTKYLFGITETFYDKMPDAVRPMRRTAARGRVLEFSNPARNPDERARNPGLESELRTVSQKNAGAGQGVLMGHLSEVALWPKESAKKTLDTFLQVIPRAGQTLVVLESTARGLGNEFHRRWRQAEQGVSEYEPFFIGWHEEPTNRIDPPAGFERTAEEQLLADDYDLDDAQLFWRRVTIENECGGDIDTFHQEYPASADEAFLSTGRPYFNQQAVRRHYKLALDTDPWKRGVLKEREVDGRRFATFEEDRRGPLRIWEAPQPLEDYILFCDSSEGASGDYQAIYVFPRSRLAIVAAWHARIDRDLLGDELNMLGRLYNEALIAVEVSGGWGLTPIEILRRVHSYSRLYKTTTVDRKTNKRKVTLGWKTTVETRALMLDSLNQALRTDALEVNDPDLLVECSTFAYNENGKPEAEEGCNDDRVITAAGGVYLWQREPRRHLTDEVVKRPRPRSTVTGY